jgi:hypothetical protein
MSALCAWLFLGLQRMQRAMWLHAHAVAAHSVCTCLSLGLRPKPARHALLNQESH